jgi:hypothetical protein
MRTTISQYSKYERSLAVKVWNSIVVLSILGTSAAFAGEEASCHFHGSKPATEATVLGCADKQKARLVDKGSVPPSWTGVSQKTIDQVDGKNGKEWRVTYSDPDKADKDEAQLYMFFSLPGNFIAANFTGK